AIMVEPYAIAVVYPNHFPAPFPRPAIAGEMSAKIKTGMKKFRKLLNSPLNVAKMRPSHSGAKRLTIMPRTIAMMILNNSESLTFDLDIVFNSLNVLRRESTYSQLFDRGSPLTGCITCQATRH